MIPLAGLLTGDLVGVAPFVWAYLDPGSGSMLFQVLIAGLLSALFCARTALAQIKQAVQKLQRRA
jgi:hypothetical protein